MRAIGRRLTRLELLHPDAGALRFEVVNLIPAPIAQRQAGWYEDGSILHVVHDPARTMAEVLADLGDVAQPPAKVVCLPDLNQL